MKKSTTLRKARKYYGKYAIFLTALTTLSFIASIVGIVLVIVTPDLSVISTSLLCLGILTWLVSLIHALEAWLRTTTIFEDRIVLYASDERTTRPTKRMIFWSDIQSVSTRFKEGHKPSIILIILSALLLGDASGGTKGTYICTLRMKNGEWLYATFDNHSIKHQEEILDAMNSNIHPD